MPLKVALCVGYAGRFVWVGGSSESFRFLLLLPSSSRFTRAACCTIFLFIDRIVKRRHTMDRDEGDKTLALNGLHLLRNRKERMTRQRLRFPSTQNCLL